MTTRAVLRHRSFLALLTGRWVSLAGNGLANIAITFAVLDLTGSRHRPRPRAGRAQHPAGSAAPFGGVIADRLPRHLVLVVSNLVCGLTQTVALAGKMKADEAPLTASRATSADAGVVGETPTLTMAAGWPRQTEALAGPAASPMKQV